MQGLDNLVRQQNRQDLFSSKMRVLNNQHQTPEGEDIVTCVKGNFVMMHP